MHKHDVYSKETYKLSAHSSQNTTLSMHKNVHSEATYHLRVHRSQDSKWVKEVTGMNFAYHTNLILRIYEHVTQWNLQAESAPVHNTASGQKKERIFTHHTKSSLYCAQTCSFKGNLLSKSAPVHNTASG